MGLLRRGRGKRPRSTIVITGARGLIGSVLWQAFESSYELVGLDVRRGRRRGILAADATDPAAVARILEPNQVVVDLAARASPSIGWPDLLQNNVPSTLNVLELSRRAGVRRVVFASSTHVTGMYERDYPYSAIVCGDYEGLDPMTIPRIGPEHPIRPDGPYALGKVMGEAAGRYYAEEFGLSVICLRIGTVTKENRPRKPRHFATLLTHRDLAGLVRCCVEAPRDVRFATFFGVSANTWRIWDIEDARRAVGYEPRDDAERWR